MPDDMSKLQPDQIKKLLKFKEGLDEMVKSKELTPNERQALLDEGVRRLQARNDSLMGKLAPYVDPAMKKAVTGYHKFAEKATQAVAGGMAQEGFRAAMHPGLAAEGKIPPAPWETAVAQQVVPQDLTTAGTDVAMAATQVGPVAKALGGIPSILRWAAEFGGPAAAGGAIAPYEGKTREQGAAQGISQVGIGKAGAGLANFLGKAGENKYADNVTSAFGATLKKLIPNYKGPLKTVQDFYYAFSRGRAPQEVGKALTLAERNINRAVGNHKLVLPDLQQANIDILGADPQTAPAEYSFQDAMKLYRKIRDRGYTAQGAPTATGAGYPAQREIRTTAHDIRDQIVSEVESFAPQYGVMLDDSLRQDAASKALNSLFTETGIQEGMLSGHMPVRELQLRLNGSRDFGYASDFDRIWGNPKLTDIMIESAQSGGAAGAGVDQPLGGGGLRVYGNPAKPGSAHMGLSMEALQKVLGGKRAGIPQPKWPRIGGAIPGAAAQAPARFLSQVEAPEEGEPVEGVPNAP